MIPRYYTPTFFSLDASNVRYCIDNRIYLEDGTHFSDFTGGLTSHSIWRWGDEKLVEVISKKLTRFPHLDYKFFYDDDRDALSAILLRALPFEGSDYSVFFPGLSGSDGIEAAIKLSYQYHCNNNEPGRKTILCFRESYHGSTLGALSLSDRPNLGLYKPLLPSNVLSLGEVNSFRNERSEEDEYAIGIEELSTVLTSKLGNQVCCLVGESIAGGLTGYVPKPRGYWSKVSELCKLRGIHLILDEVICGTGTSGKYYCFEHDGDFRPEFIVLGKTLAGGYFPLNAVVADKGILGKIRGADGRIQQSNTFQGYSAAVSAALYVQTLVSDSSFLGMVGAKSKLLVSSLEKNFASQNIPVKITGRGLRVSIQLGKNSDFFTRRVTRDLEKKERILVDGKWHRIVLSPQLTLHEDELIRVSELLVYYSHLHRDQLNKISDTNSDPQRR